MDPVVITAAQARYLFIGPTASGLGVIDYSLAITNYTPDDGWIFVEQESHIGNEGSGVWVDTNGCEHYGPHETPAPPTLSEVLGAVSQAVAKEAAQ